MTSRFKPGIPLENEDGVRMDPIFETTDFAVFVGGWPKGMWDDQLGYLLYNKRHDVCEGIMGTEALAILEARQQQEILDKVLSNQDLSPETPDDREFQAMINRLQSKQPH